MERLALVLVVVVLAACTRIQPAPEGVASRQVYLPLVIVSPLGYGAVDETQGGYLKYYAPHSRVSFPVSWSSGVPPRLAKVAAAYWTMAALRGPMPEYARLRPEKACSPPAPAYYDDYTGFVLQVAATGVAAIEVGNEPNADDSSLAFIGCWGTSYAAGAAYGEMTRRIAGAVKAAYPETQIIAGALIGAQSAFVAGMLAAVGEQVDAISYHCYPHYLHYNPDVCGEYAAYLRTMTDLPLAITETAVRYNGDCCDPDFSAHQVDYWRHVSDSLADWGVDWFTWYALRNGWDCTDLMICGTATPVYGWYKMEVGP